MANKGVLFNLFVILIFVLAVFMLFMEYLNAPIVINVGSAHAWLRHGAEATDALNCLKNNGTYVVLSESSRRLHFICVDFNTGAFYDVIVSRLYRITSDWQRQADLITAMKPNVAVSVKDYIEFVKYMYKAIEVNLKFLPEEIFIRSVLP